MTQYALSLKQPWATLLVHGLKTIEVRRWSTARRGRILIHAASTSDDRPEAWNQVPAELRASANLLGGVIGSGELINCIAYRSREHFSADRSFHLNDPSWFKPPVLYGFAFADLTILPFRPCSGWMRFFKLDWDEVAVPRRPQLLVSVRNAAEVEAALAGGADLIDVKEPERGPLGPADRSVITEVIAKVAGRRPVSAALGELLDSFWQKPSDLPQLAYAKWGLAGFQRHAPLLWQWELTYAAQRLAEANPGCQAVAVAYADWERAQAPPPDDVLTLAAQLRCGAFLIDTWNKDGSTLRDWLARSEVERLCAACRAAGVQIALAGSLGVREISELLPLRPDWFAVRGAVCSGQRREAEIDEHAVRRLADLLSADGR